MSSEISLQVEGVSRSFGSLQALLDVDLSVEAGERRAIIGPNGAGKTTLFSIISGTMPASSGRVRLFGRDITRMPPHKRALLGMSRTYQITNLFPSLTVLENVLLGIQAHRPMKLAMHRPRTTYGSLYTKAQEILDTWGLWDSRDIVVRNLSYGEQRQVEILLALAGEPKVLLLDEPTAGLSTAETQTVTNLIRGLPRDMSILLIEHDMDVVFDLVDRITVLHMGQLLAEGTPQEIQADQSVTDIYLGTAGEELFA
jgi:branched-chain amino acid transport system ATP-binding protein